MRGNENQTVVFPGLKTFQFTPLHERQPNAFKQFYRRLTDFNSRLYMRGNGDVGDSISVIINFNSRLYMRGNPMLFVNEANLYKFQFTPLHERQRSNVYRLQARADFNSRLYMRGNEQCFVIGLREISFQFTPLHERQQNVTSE